MLVQWLKRLLRLLHWDPSMLLLLLLRLSCLCPRKELRLLLLFGLRWLHVGLQQGCFSLQVGPNIIKT